MKRTICFYLSVAVVVLGMAGIFSNPAEARLIKKATATKQSYAKEIAHYDKKNNAYLEAVYAGKMTSGEKEVFGCLGILVVVAIMGAALSGGGS